MATNTYTAVIEQEGDAYVAFCPDLDIAARGRRSRRPRRT
jgi:predicted RNase H-like HicB family nuclease